MAGFAVNQDFMNIPIDGISISQTPEVIHVRSESPLNVLSSAIVGGGFRRACHILNAFVDKDYNSTNPKADLRALARRSGVDGHFVGLSQRFISARQGWLFLRKMVYPLAR